MPTLIDVFRFPPLTPTVKTILIALFAIYVGEAILEGWVGIPVSTFLVLQPGVPSIATAWQIVTHSLVLPPGPGAFFNLLLGLVFLWWFLAPFEERFGGTRVVQLCVASTLGAGIAAAAVGAAFGIGGYLAGPGTMSFAGLAAYFWTMKGRSISLFGMMNMRAEQAIWLFVGLSFLSFIYSKNVINLVGDLAAVGAGIGFVEWMRRPPKKAIFRKKKGAPKRRSGAPLRIVRDDEDPPDKRWLN